MPRPQHAPHNAMTDADEIARFHDRCSDLMRELLHALAGAPGRPRSFPQIEDSIGWPRRRIASVLGGVHHLRQTEFGGRRPYRFHDARWSCSGRWENVDGRRPGRGGPGYSGRRSRSTRDTVVAVGVVAALVFMLKTQVGWLVTGLHKASTTDALTGVLNRGAFQERLDQALAAPEGEPLVLALLDLDHFKLVNDRHGHPAGDRALRRFCEIVQAEARLDDALGRLGGEEFGLLLAGTDLEGAHSFADRLCATVARETAAGEVGLTVSIGLCESGSETTSDDLLRSADVALYSAKGAGRNRVALYGEPALA